MPEEYPYARCLGAYEATVDGIMIMLKYHSNYTRDDIIREIKQDVISMLEQCQSYGIDTTRSLKIAKEL